MVGFMSVLGNIIPDGVYGRKVCELTFTLCNGFSLFIICLGSLPRWLGWLSFSGIVSVGVYVLVSMIRQKNKVAPYLEWMKFILLILLSVLLSLIAVYS